MKKIILYTLSFFIFSSCSSEKTLSEQIKYVWDINYNSSKDDGEEKPYNLNKNLKNSTVQNQTEVQSSLHTVKNKQDFFASKDKAVPSVLTNNYSFKELTQVIQNDTINKSFNEKPQIFKNEKSTLKKSKIKDKKNKILWIIVPAFFFSSNFSKIRNEK